MRKIKRFCAFLIVLFAAGMLVWGFVANRKRDAERAAAFCSSYSPPVRAEQFQASAGGPAYAVITSAKRWPNGSTIRIRNLDGTPEQFAQVMAAAREWCQYANLNVVESTDFDAEIRVTFRQLGAWSYVGTDARIYAIPPAPTMNLGVLTTANCRHEMGHGLIALEHEHKRIDKTWTWNRPVVYADNAAVGWNSAMVDAQILNTLDPATTWQTPFDITSVMEYPFPSTWTIEGVSIPWNTELSWYDKIMASQAYPGRWSDPRPALNARVLANLRTLISEHPKPYPVAFVREAAAYDANGDGFTDLLLFIGLRIPNNRVQVWLAVFDGLSEAGATIGSPQVVGIIPDS